MAAEANEDGGARELAPGCSQFLRCVGNSFSKPVAGGRDGSSEPSWEESNNGYDRVKISVLKGSSHDEFPSAL